MYTNRYILITIVINIVSILCHIQYVTVYYLSIINRYINFYFIMCAYLVLKIYILIVTDNTLCNNISRKKFIAALKKLLWP